MFWRLHKAIFGEEIDKALVVINSFSDKVQIVDGAPSKLEAVPFAQIGEPVLALTTLQDAQRLMRKDYPSTPWLFFNNTNYEVSYWLSHIDAFIPVLNRGCVFLPYSLIANISAELISAISGGTNKVFIKPNSGNKVFTGFSLDYSPSFGNDIKNQLLFSLPDPETLCVIASHVELQPIEWRFWIVRGKIIAYSPYSWDTEPQLSLPPQAVEEIAEKMAQNSWQPDYAYVADFAITKNGQAVLVEINAASTSGVYKADLTALLGGLREIATLEWQGDLD